MHRILTLLFTLISSTYIFAQIDYSKYELLFKEDFNGTKEDLFSSGNWTPFFPWLDGESVTCSENIRIGCGSGVGCRTNLIDVSKAKNVDVRNGRLELRLTQIEDWESKVHTERDCNFLYEGSMIRSTFRQITPQDKAAASYAASQNWSKNEKPEDYLGFMYGLFEFDCIIPENSSYYPAIWLYATRGTYPEIDVFEFDHVNDKQFTFYSNVHWWDENNEKQQSRFKVKDESIFNTMHTWAIDWNEDRIIFYIDGIEYRRFTDLPKDNSAWRKVDIILSMGASFKGRRSAYFKKNRKRFDPNEVFAIEEVRVYKAL